MSMKSPWRLTVLAVLVTVLAVKAAQAETDPFLDLGSPLEQPKLLPAELPYPSTAFEVGPPGITKAESESEPEGLATLDWRYDDGIELTGFRRHGGPAPQGDPAFPTVKVSGLMQIDSLFFAQDSRSTATVGDVQDVTDFRRARLGVKGEVAKNVSYQMEYDFGFPGRPNFTNVLLDLADVGPGNLRVGQWIMPFGMESATSIREVVFLERSLASSLVPLRQVGVGLYDTMLPEDRGTWAISGYRFPTDFFGDVAGDSGYGTAMRSTLLLYDDTAHGNALHLGGSYSYNDPVSTVRLRSTPEVGFNQLDFRNTDFPVPFFADTNNLAAENYQLGGVELAGNSGPLLFQSEFYWASVNQTVGPTLAVPTAYAQVAYAITGEHHAYNKQKGAYGRIIPRDPWGPNGRGAWELAARWSFLDLNDESVEGGRLENGTLGLNWYLNQFTKMQFNYIYSSLERPAGVDSNANIFALRAQLDF